jgi:hypothetical protein
MAATSADQHCAAGQVQSGPNLIIYRRVLVAHEPGYGKSRLSGRGGLRRLDRSLLHRRSRSCQPVFEALDDADTSDRLVAILVSSALEAERQQSLHSRHPATRGAAISELLLSGAEFDRLKFRIGSTAAMNSIQHPSVLLTPGPAPIT